MLLWKLITLFVIIVISGLAAVFVDPSEVKTEALSAICTIFSVLAGLILAIYALHISSIDNIGGLNSSLSQAVIWDSRKSIARLSLFFWLYLVVLTLSLMVILGQSIPLQGRLFDIANELCTRGAVFFAIFAAGMSFFVPAELRYIYPSLIKRWRLVATG
jgi:hypothetical protein